MTRDEFMKEAEHEITKDYMLILPRMSGKRLLMIKMAIQKAKEGNAVYIADLGGDDKVLEPLDDGNIFVRPIKRSKTWISKTKS